MSEKSCREMQKKYRNDDNKNADESGRTLKLAS